MVAAESLIDLQETYNEKEDDIDSLPSTSSSASDVYSDADSDAQAEWDRSLEQLQLLLTMMIVPWVGWGRYMEWMHGVEVRWTNKKAFKAVGVVETAATL
ncbi:hypothetical protein H634G_00175 [Metarhizium anisopliae BRIP 53293]|uniref:Uncharacterized protein n=1 Tax=Metarhizium anisopliae BRIP 53293 TaxID=1291518 RepID=A0A0D9PEI3_METAN|nr:hypothetical protein H634G_00175 [Metarhizium anisopliae BRIP 53293]